MSEFQCKQMINEDDFDTYDNGLLALSNMIKSSITNFLKMSKTEVSYENTQILVELLSKFDETKNPDYFNKFVDTLSTACDFGVPIEQVFTLFFENISAGIFSITDNFNGSGKFDLGKFVETESQLGKMIKIENDYMFVHKFIASFNSIPMETLYNLKKQILMFNIQLAETILNTPDLDGYIKMKIQKELDFQKNDLMNLESEITNFEENSESILNSKFLHMQDKELHKYLKNMSYELEKRDDKNRYECNGTNYSDALENLSSEDLITHIICDFSINDIKKYFDTA